MMIALKKTYYGLRFEFGRNISLEEFVQWQRDIRETVPHLTGRFGVFVDLRALELVPSEGKMIVEEVEVFCRENGLERSVLVLAEKLTEMQMRLVASASGVRGSERYVIASQTPNWEQVALDWITDGVEPAQEVQQVMS